MAGRAIAALGTRAINLVLPPTCLSCAAAVGDDGSLCAACWSGLGLIERPYCERLGTPFAHDPGPGALSPAAMANPPPFGRLRSVALYGDVSRRLVHALKYEDHLELVRWMSGWMARAGAEIVAEAELLVPIPLHRRRLWWRRFNQSAALALGVGRVLGRAVDLTALRRVKATRQQVGLALSERATNVRGAFAVQPTARPRIAGRRVVLVDDVYTTGATIAAATRTLLRAGAASVDVLVFARVADGRD